MTAWPTSYAGSVADLATQVFDPTVGWPDLAWLREVWTGPLVVKGVQSADDAVRAVEVGADAVVLSQHGGRQLDRGLVPLEQLADVVARVAGRAEVYLDGGVLSGSDVLAAVGLGATAVWLGRAPLYGLMAGGGPGVDRVLSLLELEMRTTLQLVGVPAPGISKVACACSSKYRPISTECDA